MILTCPECSTHYKTKEGAIGPNGRSVRCAKCDAVWFESAQTRDPDELALEDNKTVLIEPTEPMSPLKGVESAQDADPQAKLPLENAVGAHVALRDRVDAEKLKRRSRVISLIWLVTIALLILAAVLAFVKRQDIVNRTPIAATAYKAVGLTVKQGGLDITAPETETLLVEGEPVLFVRANINNLTGQAQASPFLGFRLYNRSGDTLAEWYVEPGTVEAHGSKDVEARYPNPPVDGTQLGYGFAEE